jgi:hypothetical protein
MAGAAGFAGADGAGDADGEGDGVADGADDDGTAAGGAAPSTPSRSHPVASVSAAAIATAPARVLRTRASLDQLRKLFNAIDAPSSPSAR